MNGYAENAKPCSRCHKKPKWLRDPFGEYHHLGCECGRTANASSWDGATVNNWNELFGEKMDNNRPTDLAELLDLVRGSSPQLDVPRVLTGLLQCMEAHGEKLHSMFSKWHELDATVRMNAKEADAELNKVAASTGEVRKALNTLLGSGLDELHARLAALEEGLKKLENAPQQPHVDDVTRQAVKNLLATVDKLVDALRVVNQDSTSRFEALDARVKTLEKAVGGPVMERFLGLDGKGQPLTERVETAFQQAVEMDRLKRVEKDLEKLLAETQAKNLALQAELKTLQAELAVPKGLRLPECATCGVPAADHCAVPGTCKDDYPCCGNYRESP